MMEKFSVDLSKLYTNKLKLEEWFILYCLVNKEEEILVKYVQSCGPIDTEVFYNLRNSGFIVLKDALNCTFNSIIVTEITKNLFNVQDSALFDTLFRELLSTYPSSVKRITGGTRRLHNDLVRCKKLYKSCLVSPNKIDVELHKKILLCVQLYYREHLKDNKQEFMQLLATFLSQRTFEQYINEVSNIKVLTKDTKNYDAI
jgi:hypothetical protein